MSDISLWTGTDASEQGAQFFFSTANQFIYQAATGTANAGSPHVLFGPKLMRDVPQLSVVRPARYDMMLAIEDTLREGAEVWRELANR